MAIDTSNTEPISIIPGDTVKWARRFSDYPPSAGWALSYELLNAMHRYEIHASADGDSFRVVVAAQTTQAYAPGSYDWRARVTNADEVYTVATGRLTIAPSFGAAGDVRSHARRTLDAIEAVLEGRATSATAEYEINGRRLKYIPLNELHEMRTRYQREVAAEEGKSGTRGASGRVMVRFGA
ncbi:hypothetical protein J2W28_000218 [Variovorax boronicumulans]|uniref:hypothetical protein n=1 Tax=Variovorax boronicumulans TaxID=436515 RepID=UPI00278965DA|nr:hypothetical protein [Variovorax boronicumulans]MDP9990399.1 hypothetical protein [Variovorax boronicumulans]MDQ0001090.1 hypothetical protein [Variovorax boronicumulans]